MTRKRKLSMLLVLAAAATAGCQPQYFGASNLALSDTHVAYDGPVHASSGYSKAMALPVMAEHLDDQTGPIVIVDYEHNAVSRDGVWGPDDQAAYRAMALATDRCTVMVKGWRYDQWQDELIGARSAIDGIVAERRGRGWPTVVVDLQPVLRPADLSVDGVHLTTPDAARRFGAALQSGRDVCG